MIGINHIFVIQFISLFFGFSNDISKSFMYFVIIPIFFTQDPGYLKEESENTVVIIGVPKELNHQRRKRRRSKSGGRDKLTNSIKFSIRNCLSEKTWPTLLRALGLAGEQFPSAFMKIFAPIWRVRFGLLGILSFPCKRSQLLTGQVNRGRVYGVRVYGVRVYGVSVYRVRVYPVYRAS